MHGDECSYESEPRADDYPNTKKNGERFNEI